MARIVLLLWLFSCGISVAVAAVLLPPSISPSGGWIHSPALATLTNPNPEGYILYTFDGHDPRDHFGGIHPEARIASHPLSVNRSMVVRARIKSGTNWSDLAAMYSCPK